MGSFWFVLKSLIAASAVLWVLQLKVGNESIEYKAQTFIETSASVNQVRDLAAGAIQISQVGLDKMKSWLTSESRDLKEKSAKRSR